MDIGLDELNRAIGPGGDCLCRSAREPEDHCPAADQPQHEGRMQQREFIHVIGESVGQRHDDGERHGGCAHHRRADQHRLGRGLEGIAGAIVGFQQMLAAFELCVDVEVLLQLGFDARNFFDQRQLVDGLRIVGYRAVGIHGNGDRPHAEKAEGNQAEGEDRGSQHLVRHGGALTEVVAQSH